MEIELEIGGNGEGKVLYCPLCRQKGLKVRMRVGKVLVRSSRPVLRPRSLLELLQRPPFKVLLNLRAVQQFIKHHERLFYRLYFSPYKQVEGYLCEAVPSHGLTRETYLRAILGEAAPARIEEEMGEIQQVSRETLWAGLG
jgi:hypothetical protein